MAAKNEVSAQIMEHLCTHAWHGYSQPGRYGDGEGYCDVVVDGQTYSVAQGDRDCSSAIITAYEAAGVDCGGATYTGNMASCMCATGNFERMPMSYTAQRGDVYLNERDHTAMCVSAVPDLLAEFSIAETGGIDGEVGDQTGWESSVHDYYDYPWDFILRYTGKADGTDYTPPEQADCGINIHLQAKASDGSVLPEVCNNNDNAGDGVSMPYLVAWVDAGKLDVQANDLPTLQNPSNIYDADTGSVGDGSDMTKLSMYLWSPNGDMAVYYRVMVNGQWLAWMRDHTDLGGSGDTFAGNGRDPIQRVEAYIGLA